MQIDIQSRGFSLTDSLSSYARRKLLGATEYCSDHINRIVIRLSDINGPRGGADKRCHVQVVLAGAPDVVVEDTQADLYAAIDRAVSRTKRVVARKVDRRLRPSKYRDQLLLAQE